MQKPDNFSTTNNINVKTRRKTHFVRNGVVLVSLALFATAGALAVVKPTEVPSQQRTKKVLSLPLDIIDGVTKDTASLNNAPFIAETTIRSGDTLSVILQRLHVHEDGLQAFLIQNEDARSIYKLYPGRSVQAALDTEGNLVWLKYKHSPASEHEGNAVAKWLEIKPDTNGGFVASENFANVDVQVHAAEGQIISSLFGATDKAGIPDAITLQMANILSSKIDFMRDLRKEDEFRVVYETHSYEGRPSSAGRILALEFKNQNKKYEAVWFKPENASGGHYDFEGRSLRGTFLRTALQFTRISSTFGMRKHPIHGKFIGHKGVDYAAPTGTPIHSTADGTVQFVGVQRGYGNVVIIKHHGKYSTLYAHQSRFAKGLKKGSKVSQGDVIGYVGSTGWATGPHLHYEFRVDNQPVNPLTIDLPEAVALEESDLNNFKQVASRYKEHFNLVARLNSDRNLVASK